MNFRFFLFFILMTLLMGIPVNNALSQASSDAKTHTVEVRETLFSISRKYNITVQNIRDWNKLESDVIPPGTVLLVSKPPVQSTPTRTEPAPKPEPVVVPRPVSPDAHRPQLSKPESSMENEEVIHVVDQGETMFSISRMYKISIADLQKWNNLESTSVNFNQRLIVGFDTTYTSVMVIDTSTLHNNAAIEENPVTSPTPPVVIPEEDRLRVDEENTTAEFYTVRPGDTLSSISRRYGVTLSDLRRWNSISGDVISIGQELVVGRTMGTRSVTGLTVESTAQGRFYEYEMKRNDSIYRILLNHKMDEVDFQALNSGLSPSDVRAGMNVVLLAPPTTSHQNPYLIRPSRTSNNDSGVNAAGLTSVTRYNDNDAGQTTTGGDLYNPNHLTAAHQTLSLGSVVHVVNPENNKGIFVLINDRVTDSSIKLSKRALEALGLHQTREPKVEINTNVN